MRPNLTPQELEELRRITNRDPYPNNFPDDYDKTKVDPRVRLRTSAVKNKLIGLDTREAMEQAPEIISVVATEAKELSEETSERQDELEEHWETVLAETTDGAEVIDARTDIYGIAHKTLKKRIDAMQENEIVLFKSDEVNDMRTILDNEFSNNHEVTVIQQVDSDNKMPGLIIAEIDNPTQNRFTLEKVGSI